jgi:hypothetical protein
MKIKLDALHLTLLAALGFEPACAVRPTPAEGDGTGSDGSSSVGDGDGTPEPHTCANPQDVLQAGTELPSGFVMCDDGFIHRAEQTDAVDPQGADDPNCAAFDLGCKSAAECVAQPYGRCVEEPLAGCLCSYGCVSDADCADGYACAPAGVAGPRSTCIFAECITDADCGEGLCGLSEYEGCCGIGYQLACASPTAACHVDADCSEQPCIPDSPESGLVMYQCAVQSDNGVEQGEWTCKPPGWCQCDCGRPFLVDGRARVALTRTREDWLHARGNDWPSACALDPVDADVGRVLVEHWTRAGQFEHASIASFGRFAMQLLQLGAPAALLRDTARAAADEIEHARLCFGLASAYAGRAIGPAGLDVAEPSRATDLHAIVEGLIVEACVGETIAAIEAREAALWAEHPRVAAVLEQIADDEWRHARLGWAALGWLLRHADAGLRAFALRTFTSVLAVVDCAEPDGHDQIELRRYGVLDASLRANLRSAAIRELILPCVAALRERDTSAEPLYIAS